MRALLGPFRSLFFSFRFNYLNLLGFENNYNEDQLRLEKTLEKFDKIFLSNSISRLKKGINNLIKSGDWRHDLVACTAIAKLKHEDQQLYSPVLWNKLQKDSSWVYPQILGLLSQLDIDFIQNFKIHMTDIKFDYKNFQGNTIVEFIEFLNKNYDNKIDYKYCLVDMEWGKQVSVLVKK